MKQHRVCAVAAVIFGACIATTHSFAEELTGTLKKISTSHSIAFGVRDASIPFSFADDKQAYQGYSVDLCTKIANAVQKELGLPALQVAMVPVAAATRIPLMANGTIDLECGASTNNVERQKQVAFAPTTFLSGTRLLSKKSSGIQALTEMKGKNIVSVAGTSNLKQIVTLNAAQNLGMNVLVAQDHPEAFMMLETGRAVAFAMDDILLASMVANAKTPANYVISKEALSIEPYAIMLRKDDPAFKKLVDKTFAQLFHSGEIEKIYTKWFLSPIPPKGINLNWAMTEQLKMVFAHPTDSGDPASYASTAAPSNQQANQQIGVGGVAGSLR